MKKLNNVECIYEKVFVETPVDTDGDGLTDLIAVYITRPKSTLDGEKVPAVMVANPYLMFCNEDWYDLHDVNHELKVYSDEDLPEPDVCAKAGAQSFNEYVNMVCSRAPEDGFRTVNGIVESNLIDALPEFECISGLYEYLNQKGYASVFSGGLGTRGSDGLTLSGSADEIVAFRSIVDWLNGRAKAFTDKTSGIEIKADWCTGNVAMSGKSYLGTLCFGVAATGVEGLKAIIPEAGISNWYNYYRNNGLVVPPFDWQGDDSDLLSLYCCSRAKDADYSDVENLYREKLADMISAEDRDSGNYNEFWDERNYLKHASEFKAAVFIIHGINDWNVKTDQCFPMFKALMDEGKDCRIMLHQGEHIYIYDLQDSGNLEAVESWLDYYLKGQGAALDASSRVLVESNLDQKLWYMSENWPPEGTGYERFPVNAGECNGYETGARGGGCDRAETCASAGGCDRAETCASAGGCEVLTIVDDLGSTAYDKEADSRQAWRDELILGDAGKAHFLRFETAPLDAERRISGYVDVSLRASLDKETGIISAMLVDLGEARRITAEQVLTNENSANPEEFRFAHEDEPSQYKVISRGWLNAQNHKEIWTKSQLAPGQKYDFHFSMVPTDHTVPAGHKLALIIYGADADYTLRSDVITKIDIDANTIEVYVPFAG